MQSNILPVILLLLLKLNSDADVKFVDTEKISKSEHSKAVSVSSLAACAISLGIAVYC